MFYALCGGRYGMGVGRVIARGREQHAFHSRPVDTQHAMHTCAHTSLSDER